MMSDRLDISLTHKIAEKEVLKGVKKKVLKAFLCLQVTDGSVWRH